MLFSSLYGDDATDVTVAADAEAAAAWPTGDPSASEAAPSKTSGASGPFIVVGVALALGIAAAKWIAWGSRE